MEYLQSTLCAVIAVIAVIAPIRFNRLRSFAQMSMFAFALTIATGSVLASVIALAGSSAGVGLAAIAGIFITQRMVSSLRQRYGAARRLSDNQPLLLMDGPSILLENLRRARVPGSDLIAKLREANVLHLDQVRAAVLETTGDISVLHGPRDGPAYRSGCSSGRAANEDLLWCP